jgi:hypothetical protein
VKSFGNHLGTMVRDRKLFKVEPPLEPLRQSFVTPKVDFIDFKGCANNARHKMWVTVR